MSRNRPITARFSDRVAGHFRSPSGTLCEHSQDCGAFHSPLSGISWSRGGERMGSASLFAESGSLRLSYQTTTSEGSAERIDERVEIWSTQTSLGGQRQWFRCPGCHRQCRILYGGPRFRCRLCHGLSYESQFESRTQRANRRARKIRRRLGGSDCLMEEFPPRPRGMHWATYRRFEAQEVAADEQWTLGVIDLLARVGKRRP